jgi:selenocysteine lyase/cysteine desulfurase
VRPAPEEIPGCFETGTLNHEGCAGVTAAVDYFADIGDTMAADFMPRWSHLEGRRQALHAALDFLFDYEMTLADRLIGHLLEIEGVTVQGITAADAMQRRVPTVAFTHTAVDSAVIAKALGASNIFVWSGHNYAVEVAKTLGIYDSGGAVRVGPVHYNSLEEIDTFADALASIVDGNASGSPPS